MNRLFSKYLLPLLTLAALTGAACSTTIETNANRAANGNSTATVTSNTTSATTSSPGGSMSGMSNMNGGMSGMDHSMMQSSPNAASQPYDLQFIDTMIMHHQGAIDMARPATTKAQHAELKEMARNIIRDQEREIAQMKQLREQWYAGKPQALNMEMPGMMDSMKGMDMNRMNAATGNEFDLMFLQMMTPHHAGATTMAKEALTKAEHPEIKTLANQIIKAQEEEIKKMQAWKKAWSK